MYDPLHLDLLVQTFAKLVNEYILPEEIRVIIGQCY